MSEIALKFLAANLGAGLAILAVLVLRKPVRTMFGASLAYALWLLAPLVALASVLPPRAIEIVQPAADVTAASHALPGPPLSNLPMSSPPLASLPEPAPASPVEVSHSDAAAPSALVTAAATPGGPVAPQFPPVDPWSIAALVWFAGAVIALALQARNQSRFMTDARGGIAGPAVAGFLRPRIVTPSDFEERFDRREREIILAHERIHLDRNDARINGLVVLVRCLCWFNPLIHIAAHFMRIDQELACDAAVVERHPKARGLYASALLKAQLASRPLPMGCYWPARAEHPLMQRIEMLKLARPGKHVRLAGAGMLALLAIGSGVAAWAANPPVTRYTTIPAHSALAESATPAADAPAPAPHQAEPIQPELVQPELLLPEPQQAPAPPPSGTSAYDPADPVYLRGKVERIDFGDTKYSVFVRASSIADSETSEASPDTRLWELSPTPYWGDRETVNADLKDHLVIARGYSAKDKSCQPACKLLTRGLIVPKSTALPAVAPSDSFGVVQAAQTYDMNRTYAIQGKVERIEFSDRTFDAYVLTAAKGPVPASLYQVRSEYRFPRADIEKELLGQDVRIAGWPARSNIKNMNLDVWTIDSNCAATCAMYGMDFMRSGDVTRITPDGAALTFPVRSRGLPPGPIVMPPDSNEVLILTGKVTAARPYGLGFELVVEEISRGPVSRAGKTRPGTVWTVLVLPPASDVSLTGNATMNSGSAWIGRTATFTRTNPRSQVIGAPGAPPRIIPDGSEDCERNCSLMTTNIMTFD